MAANTAPIYVRTPQIGMGVITAANTAMDGTGTVVTVFTADATEGSFVERLRIRALGTNVASVLRVFLNNGGANSSAANNALIDEVPLPATSASNTTAQPAIELGLNMALPAGWTIMVTLGTAVAAGYEITALGGRY